MFSLDSQLAADTYLVGRFSLSVVLLAKDANYPWCILVPERDDIREIHHLSQTDQIQLMKESSTLASVMESLFTPDKMNIAAIGNKVSQLHVHHVARFKTDAVWPKPIWGAAPAKVYDEVVRNERLHALRGALIASEQTFNE